ncbi:hypothetical protein [Lacibacter sediminis]|nr:hypothetical protein [Lacibacter sediminis]
MRAKSLCGNSTEKIKTELEQMVASGKTPAPVIIFIQPPVAV